MQAPRPRPCTAATDNEPGTPQPLHNFSFTSEVRYWFSYSTSKQYTLDFTGDDDVWSSSIASWRWTWGHSHPVEGQIVLNATGAGLSLSPD